LFKAKPKEVKEKPKVPNAIVITPGSGGTNGTAYLDTIENAPGMARKCLNDGKLYHIVTKNGDKIEAIRLPDSLIYFDPKEYINALTMPCAGKFFGWADDMWQKISIGAMVVVIFAEIIGFALAGA